VARLDDVAPEAREAEALGFRFSVSAMSTFETRMIVRIADVKRENSGVFGGVFMLCNASPFHSQSPAMREEPESDNPSYPDISRDISPGLKSLLAHRIPCRWSLFLNTELDCYLSSDDPRSVFLLN
jgi:hypothetical protein